MQTPRDRHTARTRKRFNTWLKHHNPVEALPFRIVVDSAVDDETPVLKWLS